MVCIAKVLGRGHKYILSTDFHFGKNAQPVSARRIEVKRARFHTETEIMPGITKHWNEFLRLKTGNSARKDNKNKTKLYP